MFRNIIVLAPQGQQLALCALLKAHNPALTFTQVTTPEGLMAIDVPTLQQSRLLAFASGVIVPAKTLNALGYDAYNFHPGSPDYPGWAPAHFAMYDGVQTFGATAHLMTEAVDAGPIVGTEHFVIPAGTTVKQLEQIAYVRLAYLFWRLSPHLATQIGSLPMLPIAWGKVKSTRRMYEAMCALPFDITSQEMQRRIKAFDDDFRGIQLTLTLHGVRFQAVGIAEKKVEPQTTKLLSIECEQLPFVDVCARPTAAQKSHHKRAISRPVLEHNADRRRLPH